MKRWLFAAAALLLLALGAGWFLTSFERVLVREWVGPSGEAVRNPFLAARRLAERMGLRVREARSLAELEGLARSGIVVLPARRLAIEPLRLRNLVAWVEGGGHLIVEAEPLEVSDALLALLGVHRVSADPGARTLLAELPDGRRLSVSAFGGTALQVPERDAWLRVGTPEAARLVSFAHGRGMVTVAGSLDFARNARIGAADHAELLWQLFEASPTAELRIYLRPERLSLWRFLTEQAWAVMSSAALLLALWLWRVAPRFGPVAPEAPPARRRLLDHLRASGRYYWARGLRTHLAAAARDGALRHVARARPDFAGAASSEQRARLSALAALSAEESARFLAPPRAPRGAEFIRIVQAAQRIHRALEKGER